MDAQFWLELGSAFVYGVLSSVIPVFNVEAFIAATQAADIISPWSLGIGVGLGQGVGKGILFQIVRQGKKLPWARFHKREVERVEKPEPEPGSWRYRWQRLVKAMMALVEHKYWGPPVTFLSGAISMPPNFVTTLLAATTRVNFLIFTSCMTAGFIVRDIVESLFFAGVLDQWLR